MAKIASVTQKRISVVIPFYNEKENLPRILTELNRVRHGELARFAFEIILMDNHSTDGSREVAIDMASQDSDIRVIRLSRNFGYQANILTGFLNATGDAVVQLDADGEDDPKLIVEFVRHWERGYAVVYGIRRKRVESFLMSLQRRIFYRVIHSLSSVSLPADAGDFRLLDRKVIEVLRSFGESAPYLRGLVSYAGYDQVGIPYDRRPRFSGESKFSWWGYLEFAWDGITSFSRKPLSLATWAGFTLAAMSFLAGLFYLGLQIFFGTKAPGFTTIVLLQLFLCGIQLLCIGILGTYIGRIFDDVKARPRSVIETDTHSRDSSREARSA